MNSIGTLPADWRSVLGSAASDPVLDLLEARVAAERAAGDVYPTAQNVFAALRLTPYQSVRAVIIGQDPYHGPGEAHGLAFSVPQGVKVPPSLRNIHAELHSDCGLPIPTSGSLERWAKHGVLLINAILTVAKDKPASHRNLGWQAFTGEVIAAVKRLDHPVVFLLWGAYAKKVAGDIEPSRHVALYASHPSPYSAPKGFLGKRPFSRANDELVARGATPIDWSLQ